MSVRGRRVVITGANTGVGRATAMALGASGARLVLGCRSRARGEAVVAELLESGGEADVIHSHGGRGRSPLLEFGVDATLVVLDLGSLASVDEGARAIAALGPIDVLINNAAVAGARGVTSDGFELAFGVNHLGHFALTERLLESLAPDARVVHLGSGSHQRVSALDFDTLARPTRTRTGIHEYAVSKLCQTLYHHALARRFEGSGRMSLCADPGDVASDAWRHVPWPVRPLLTWRMKSPAEGARTSVFCATHPGVQNGGCYANAAPTDSSPLARDPDLAEALLARSAQWVARRAAGSFARSSPM